MHGNEHHEGRFYRCVLLLLPPIPSEIPIVLFSPESPPPVAESETGGVFFFSPESETDDPAAAAQCSSHAHAARESGTLE
jgi:hypothetical protein